MKHDGALERFRRHRVSLLLLLLMYLDLAWSIQEAKWCEGLHVLQWIVMLAISIGFLLALSRWRGFVAHAYSLVAGFTLILLIMCAQLSAGLAWADRVLELGLRVGRWISIVLSNQVNYDNLVFVLQLAVYLWLFSYLAAWGLFRLGKTWWAVLPCGIGMLLNLYYAPPRLAFYFAIYLLLALILLVRVNFQRREEEWTQARVGYAPDISFDFLRDGLLIGLLVITLAWALPVAPTVTAIARIGDRLETPRQKLQDQWNRVFANLTSYSQRESESFSRTMVLSGPVQLSDALIMDIEAAEGYYWHAIAYDFYTGRGWLSTYEDMGPLGKGASPISPPPYALRQPLTQIVHIHVPTTRAIVGASQLWNVDIAADAALLYLPREETTAERPPADIQFAYARYRLRQGDHYEVVSWVSIADEESLRRAGTDYPDWVLERYLQLPRRLPARVRALAIQLTQNENNAYDKAVAIERYLRRIPYNPLIYAPPPEWDAVDYFLFESRQGYCDYYASAMVVLARAAGIPARLVRGYSRGEKVEGVNVYRVREKNGHAWPELFFPPYGWIEFEPTAAEPVIPRPTPQPTPGPEPQDQGDLEERERDRGRYGPEEDIFDAGVMGGMDWRYNRTARTARQVGIGLGLAAVLFMLTWGFWRLIEPKGLLPAQRAYLRMTRLARLCVGLAPAEQQTPFEYAMALAAHVPAASEGIHIVTRLYVQECFSRGIAQDEAMQALETWKHVALVLVRRPLEHILARFAHRVQGWQRSLGRLYRERMERQRE